MSMNQDFYDSGEFSKPFNFKRNLITKEKF